MKQASLLFIFSKLLINLVLIFSQHLNIVTACTVLNF